MKLILRITLAFSCLVTSSTYSFSQDAAKEINTEGIKIIYKKVPKNVVTASFFIRGGSANLTEAQQGIESLALSLALSGGTKKLDKDAFAEQADKLGTSSNAAARPDFSTLTMTCLKDKWSESWSMFVDAIVNPAMDQNEFGVLKTQMIAGVKQEEANPDGYLYKLANEKVFGGSDYAKMPNGTVASLEKLTLADTKKYYQNLLGKKRCYLVVVGDIEEADLVSKIKSSLAKLPAGPEPKKPTFKSVTTPAVNIKDRDIATNYILGIMNAPKYHSEDGPVFELAMKLLYDRYFVELRTKRSLSYAPAAFYSKNTIQQPTARLYITSIDPKQSLQVMTDIIKDITKNGFTEKEIKDMKKSYLTEYYMENEASEYQAYQLGFCEASGNWRLFDELNSKIKGLNTEQVSKTFAKYMKTINWTYLGKKDKVTSDDFKQVTAPAKKLAF